MLIVAVILLIFGIFSTGLTRKSIYKRENARRSGKTIVFIGLLISYLLLFLWIFITSAISIISFTYLIFSSLCSASGDDSCLDFGLFTKLFPNKNEDLKLCRGALEQFCAISNTIIIWYFIGLVGCLAICLGLLIFITAGIANYVHINAEAKSFQLREIVQSEVALASQPFQTPIDTVFRKTRTKDKFDNDMSTMSYSPL